MHISLLKVSNITFKRFTKLCNITSFLFIFNKYFLRSFKKLTFPLNNTQYSLSFLYLLLIQSLNNSLFFLFKFHIIKSFFL